MIIRSMLNNPGQRSLETIAKLNCCTVDDVYKKYEQYCDACAHQMRLSVLTEDLEDAKDKLYIVKKAFEAAKSAK